MYLMSGSNVHFVYEFDKLYKTSPESKLAVDDLKFAKCVA